MTDKTSIEWTDSTWNPIAGCSRVSVGCDNCYAQSLAHRLEEMGQPKYKGLTAMVNGRPVWNGKIRLDDRALNVPRAWRKPRRVFVNSMSDAFHPEVPAWFVSRMWNVMAETPRHQYQILTKRPRRMAAMTNPDLPQLPVPVRRVILPLLPNVWLGTSVEDQDSAHRVDHLRDVRAAVRFLSVEPLLGPLDLNLDGIDWVIVGGESGPRFRPPRAEWVRSVRDQCERQNTAFFFKQWGGHTPKAGGRTLDGRIHDAMPVELEGR